MLAEVDYRVSTELLDHPPVGGEVVVRRREIGVVVDRDRVLPESPRRLNAHEDVSESESRHHEVPTVHVQISRRRTPVLLDLAPQALGQPAEPLSIAFRVQASGGVPELFCGQEFQIMAPGRDERMYELVSSLWRGFDCVASRPHCAE